MKIEEAFEQLIGKDCIIYTVAVGGAVNYSIFECIVEEVGEGWVKISEKNGDGKSYSIVNTRNIVRLREYPLNKKGNKKLWV